MTSHFSLNGSGSFVSSRSRLPRLQAVLLAAICLLACTAREVPAQNTPGPNSNYNWNYSGPQNYNWGYSGMPYYNPTYAQYGIPGVGVSPWDPIVQAQLNLGMKTARYQMYDAWANQMNAAANLYNQQAIAQAMQNAQHQNAVPPRYDVRQRVPRVAPASDQRAPRLLARNEVLKDNGDVLWPDSAPTEGAFGPTRTSAEAAIKEAFKEYQANGRASIQSVAEAKSMLFAYGKPVLEESVQSGRAQARRLLTFFTSLERVLNSLAGE
jgi:hypothetical protein